MVRVTTAPARKRRIKRVLKAAKGFVGDRKNHHRLAKDAVYKAWAYAYTGRKEKKRDFRALWIARINPAARVHGLSYSRLIDGMTKSNIEVNRKMLAMLANDDPMTFKAICDEAKKALASKEVKKALA